jgi:hypothetical protein
VTTIPPITPLPSPPPSTSDPTNFDTRADALLGALPTFGTEQNAAIAAMNTVSGEVTASAASAAANATAATTAASVATNATNYLTRITLTLAIGTGAKSLTGLVSTLAMVNGDDWYLVDPTNAANRMHGIISSHTAGSSTATLTVASGGFAGSGSPTSWLVVHADLMPLLTGIAADLLLGTSTIAGLTAGAIYAALAEVTLTDAATIALDMSTFINGVVTLAGNRILGNPSNAKPGQTGHIRIVQDPTGSRTLSYSSNWKFPQAVAPSLTATANHYDTLEYEVITTSLIHGRMIRDFA